MSEEISKRILDFLSSQDWPVTTEQVARAAGVSWNTAQIHLFRLAAQGKLEFRRVGRQNQWRIRRVP